MPRYHIAVTPSLGKKRTSCCQVTPWGLSGPRGGTWLHRQGLEGDSVSRRGEEGSALLMLREAWPGLLLTTLQQSWRELVSMATSARLSSSSSLLRLEDEGGERGDTLHLPSQHRCPGLQEQGRCRGSNVTTKAVERARHNLLSAPPCRARGHLTQAEQQGWLSLQPRAPGRVNSLLGTRRDLCKKLLHPAGDALPPFKSSVPSHPPAQMLKQECIIPCPLSLPRGL